jgi:hypothetical protein
LARTTLPDPLQRRHLVEEDLPEKRALALAEAYLAEGRTVEAVAFLAKAGARDRLAQLADEAIALGDVFLVREVAARLGEEPDAATWTRIAEAAEAVGKASYAREARRMAAARS